MKGSARKTGCTGCFLFFRRPAINGSKPKLLFKSPATAKTTAICSLPRGGGLGRGHSPNFGNLSQYPTTQNTSLAACCSLSNSLPRERGQGAVGIKGAAIPTYCVRALRHTPYRRVQRSSEKTLAAFVPSALRCRLPEKFLLLIFRAFFFRRPATPESAATRSLPCGGGLGRGHSPSCGNLPNT